MVQIRLKSELKVLRITDGERMRYDALNHVMTLVVSLLRHSTHGRQSDVKHIDQCEVARTYHDMQSTEQISPWSGI